MCFNSVICQLARMHMVYKRLISTLQSLVPQYCPLCGSRCYFSEILCTACVVNLPQKESICPQCGIAIETDSLCGACQSNPPMFSRTFFAFDYGPPINRLIQQFKYSNRLDLGRDLGITMASQLEPMVTALPDSLIPVPLHRSKLRQRGYNQALELARWLSRHFGIPVDSSSISRNLKTPAQTGLPYKQRRNNIVNAFNVKPQYVLGKHIALIDDVMTTGSTANELSRILRKSGATQVDVWVFARVQPMHEGPTGNFWN